ncbi:DUF1836 domain-containing protein [Paenibacillus sp. L3-i20]|uniref:DUF1836 domain-containing protein n=1 Tax=Paenibacillus sp. L3-i20 TaxID=2905833 RepID=UPI001EDD5B46|nr:DUF1836 domain-containing protein [Paenibacillus sp. L3-i20]GKU78325.1 hypothetical protein L3i20_v227220 [Paenibacillus sp. L3-i20]
MESYTLTRQELAFLLLALEENCPHKATEILQNSWNKNRVVLPSIVEKLMRCSERKGFSLHEIADLGNLLEFSTLSATSMQNWVKRDFKLYFSCPMAGKKYSLKQAAMLLMIDDLKSNLDFETIRRLFSILFEPSRKEEQSTGNLVSPLVLFSTYSTMYEELDGLKIGRTMNVDTMEGIILENAVGAAYNMKSLTAEQQAALCNILFVAVISIQSAYFQSLARRYCQEILYMKK